MSTQGVDYSFSRPDVAALKRAGKRFVCRYLSGGSSAKDIDAAEARALLAAGLGIVLVWESGGARALGGHTAGSEDAHRALAQANALGVPSHVPLYFAVDFDPSGHLSTILDYFRGVCSQLSVSRVGLYGGYDAVKAVLNANGASYAWETYAWSGGKWDPRNDIEQYLNGQHLAGGTVDLDRAVSANYGAWGVVPTPPPPRGDHMNATQAEVAAIADAVWKRFELNGKNLATVLEETRLDVADIKKKVGA